MKPQILYCLPRSRSTAILQASRKPHRLFEPFSHMALFPGTSVTLDKTYIWQENVPWQQWEAIRNQMNSQNTVTKFFGWQIAQLNWAKEWFSQVQSTQSHDIFVIHRPLEEVCWSYAMAYNLGWFYEQMREENTSFSIQPIRFIYLDTMIRMFLHHLPEHAHLISWEHLPSNHFDSALVQMRNQNSNEHRYKISNLDQCQQQINRIVQRYSAQYEEKVFRIPWAPL